MDDFLFDKGAEIQPSPGDVATEAKTSASFGGIPRLRMPHRDQVELQWLALDELLEADHPARVVWDVVCGLDLRLWLQDIRAVEGGAGRDATDPRLLVALWIYATIDGVGSARELARLCQKHLAYRWLCGGVGINHHLLSDFRSQGGEKWDALLTQIVASLMAENLVSLRCVAQDGMRVRAQAGTSSFHRRPRLQQCLEEARQQVEALKQQADESSEEVTRRQQAARKRAASERQERLEEALRQCEQLQQEREKTASRSGRKAQESQASTTDPEARKMKFADGGTRPGYNVQFATDTNSQVIVGVDVSQAGNDQGELPPMLDQIEDRTGRRPDEAVVDGGFVALAAIEEASQGGCTVYAPLKEEAKQLEAGKDPYAPKAGDSPAVASWRARMGTAAAKTMYRLRCQTAEWVNAICRNRGFWMMPVRGRVKCRIVATLYAITHDVLQGVKLRAEAAMNGT
jgi:transposase